MLKKILLLSLVSTTLINTASANEDLASNSEFIELMECINNSPINKTSINGVSLNQAVLVSVLQKPTKQKSASLDGIDIDYSGVYQMIVKHCPNELNKVKQLMVKTQ